MVGSVSEGDLIKRILVALLFLVAACGGNDGSVGAPSDADGGSGSTVAESGGSDTGSGDSESSDSGSDATSDGTQIFVASGFGIDVVDLAAETQEVFVDGYDSAYGLIVAQDHLWFADAQSSLVSIDARSGDVIGHRGSSGPVLWSGSG